MRKGESNNLKMKPKNIYKFDIDSQQCVGMYNSIAEAAAKHEVAASAISKALAQNMDCTKPSHLVKGFAWSYDSNYQPKQKESLRSLPPVIDNCPFCGKEFRRYPSDTTNTCGSSECKAKRASLTHKGIKFKWSPEAREKLLNKNPSDNLKLGTPAAQISPLSGAFDTNVTAKYWKIQAPSGEVFEFNNLLKWCRENADLFGKEVGNPRDAHAIASAFRAIKQTRQGKPKRAYTYKQWELLDYREYNTLHGDEAGKRGQHD